MKPVISQTFAITAQKPTVSVDHIDNYYITEASGIQPAANDSRWQFVPEGQQVPVPTSAAPYLWHKSITYLTDGSHLDPVIEFGGSLGQNGYDYDLVPSHSAIIKAQDDTVTPANVSCSLIKRNADGSAERITTPPAGYSVKVYRDTTEAAYTLGTNVSTANVSVVTFVLLYGTIEVERHDIRVIAEGAEGLTGRGIQSQSTRFKANTTGSVPATPTNDNEWNTWSALSQCGYSETNRYLFQCVRTVFVDGNGNTSVEYLVSGPTVWGRDGDDAFVLDLDNEMDSLPCDSTGKVTKTTTIVVNVKLYKGATQITSGITAPTAASVKLAGVTPTVSQSSGNISVSWKFSANTALADERYIITIPVTYNEKTYQVAFTLNALRSGAPGVSPTIYKVLPSHQSLAFSRNSSDTLTPSSHSLTCGYSKNYNGTISTVANQTTAFDTTYRIFYRYLSNGSWSAWYAYSSAITVNSSTSYTSYEFCIAKTTVANDVTDSLILDRETIPIIKSGQKGNTGANAFSLDIDNEMAAIPVNQQGKVETLKTLTFGLQAYYGTTPVGPSCTITAENIPTGFTVNLDDPLNPVVTIAADTTPAEISEITFKAVHATYGTREAVFTVCAVKSGGKGEDAELYQLLPSQTTLPFDRNANGNINTRSYTLTSQIQLIKGNVTTNYSSLSGYYLYYGWNGAASPSSILSTSGITVSQWYPNNGYTSVVLELWRGARSVDGSVRLDRETIPIITDGTKGGPGDPGNGINGIYFYRMFTQSFEAPAENDSGWIASTSGSYPTEAGLTKENRYLWQKKLTSYTRSDTPTIEISLLAQFDTGVQENLLEDTAFLSEGQMEAWTAKNGGIGVNTIGSHNSFGGTPVWENLYTELLQQKVYEYGVLQKLKANTWYTLSFWGAMQSYQDLLSSSVYNGSDGGSYWQIGASRRGFWLSAGQQAIVTVTGRCYSSNVYLKVFGFEENWESGLTSSVTFTSTSSQTKSFLVKNTSSANKYFYVEGYVYLSSDDSQNTYTDLNHRCYITLIRVDRGCKMASYLYRSDGGQAVQHSSSAPWYVDGKKYTAGTVIPNPTGGRNVTLYDGTTANVQNGTQVGFADDGYVYWQLSPGHYRHSVTFKTPSSLSTSAQYRVLFRLISCSHYGWISMPKLEENTIATDWIENTNDRMADDIQHVYDGPWESGKTYFYGGGTGVRHVVRAKESVSGAMTYWRMKQRTTSSGYTSTTQPYNDTTHWEKASYLKFIATDFILADEASITLMNTNRVLVMKSDGSTVAAGMGGAELGDTDFPLWIGATYADRANAPFKVNLLGHVFATRGTVGGWVLKDGMLISQLGKINGSYSNDYDNVNFIPNISFNALAGEVIAGQNLRLSDVGLQLYDNNRLCAKIANQSISQQIDTTPSIASATISKSVSNSIYLPTGDSRYTGTATWQISQDFGYMYNGSTIQLRNANFSCSFPSSVGSNTFHYNTGKVSVILSNGSKNIVIDTYSTYVGSSNSISANRSFDRTITIDGETYPEGRYYVYYKVEVSYSVSGGQSGSSSATTFQLSNAYYRYSQTVEQVCLIGNNGFFNRQGAQCYLMSTQYGFKTQYGNYILEIGSSGIRYSKNNGSSWTTL